MQVAFTVKAIITASQQPPGHGVGASIAHALRAELANPIMCSEALHASEVLSQVKS